MSLRVREGERSPGEPGEGHLQKVTLTEWRRKVSEVSNGEWPWELVMRRHGVEPDCLLLQPSGTGSLASAPSLS